MIQCHKVFICQFQWPCNLQNTAATCGNTIHLLDLYAPFCLRNLQSTHTSLSESSNIIFHSTRQTSMWRRVNDGEIGHCESRNSCSQTQPVDGELENVCTLLPHYLKPVPPGSMTHDAFNAVLFSFFLIIICFSWDSAEARSYGCTQILATSANVLSKYGDFRVFFLKMWLLWFFPKEILIFVLALQCGKFRQKEFEYKHCSGVVKRWVFFLAQFCDVAKVVNIQKLFFNIILAI